MATRTTGIKKAGDLFSKGGGKGMRPIKKAIRGGGGPKSTGLPKGVKLPGKVKGRPSIKGLTSGGPLGKGKPSTMDIKSLLPKGRPSKGAKRANPKALIGGRPSKATVAKKVAGRSAEKQEARAGRQKERRQARRAS